MKIKNKTTYILDNNGETFDRYTIILPDGEMLGASQNPFSPLGFGQHCGNCIENYLKETYGSYWRNLKITKKETTEIIAKIVKASEGVGEGKWGVLIEDIKQVPEGVVKFIEQNL